MLNIVYVCSFESVFEEKKNQQQNKQINQI